MHKGFENVYSCTTIVVPYDDTGTIHVHDRFPQHRSAENYIGA